MDDGLGFLLFSPFLLFGVIVLFGVSEKEQSDPVVSKVEACESRAAEILGGTPQFERGTEEVKDDKYTITGKVTTTFDNAENEKTYTCTVEVVDGDSVAKIDSIA